MGLKKGNFKYSPCLFEVDDLETAKRVILTPEQGTTTEERWEKETPYIVEQISECLKPDPGTCILDYGCGVGRIMVDGVRVSRVGMRQARRAVRTCARWNGGVCARWY